MLKNQILKCPIKMSRPVVSLALAGILTSTSLSANDTTNLEITPYAKEHLQQAPLINNNYGVWGDILKGIIGGIASGIGAGSAGGLIGWIIKQAENAGEAPNVPEKIWRIKAGLGFNLYPNKQYDLYQSLLSADIQSGWAFGDAAWHYWVRGGQWNKLEVDMKSAVGTYNLSGLINYTGGDLDVDMQKATLRLGQFNGNSFTSFNNRTTRVDFNAKNILIDNFLEINNRVGDGLGRKPNATVLTLQSQEGITSNNKAELYLYNGATLNLVSKSVDFKGAVWMGRMQYPLAYLSPSWSMINTAEVNGKVNFNHLIIGDHNNAQAGIVANNDTNIGTLDLWQSAGLYVIAPPKGGYKKEFPQSTPNNQEKTAKKDKSNNDNNNGVQVINAPNSSSNSQKVEVEPVQVINGPFPGAKNTVVNINRLNVDSDGTIRAGGFKAVLTTNAANLNIGDVNIYNRASGRTLLVENETGNITVNGPLMVNNQVGKYGFGFVGSSANFIFKAGTYSNHGIVTFNSNIDLGSSVNLEVDAKVANFKDINASNAHNGASANSLNFSNVGMVNIDKLTTASTNVAVKNFHIKELYVTTSHGLSEGQYTYFGDDIGSKSVIDVVRLQRGYNPLYSGGVKFKKGEKLTIGSFYHAGWNYFDARKIKEVVITKLLTFGAPGSIEGMTGLMFNNLTLAKGANMDYGKDLDLYIQGNFTNNQAIMNLNTQDGRVATLNVGNRATFNFNDNINSQTGFYNPLIKINYANTLTKNVEHVLVSAQDIDYDNTSSNVNTDINQESAFKERIALYNSNHERMDICVVQNLNDIRDCGMAIGNKRMVSDPSAYKYLEGRAWRNTAIDKVVTHKEIAVSVQDSHIAPNAKDSKDFINLPHHNENEKFAHYTNFATLNSNATPHLVAINQNVFGTIESVFELANRFNAIKTIKKDFGAQGRNLLQTMLIDAHNAGYARQMIDKTSTNTIIKDLSMATSVLNHQVANLENKTSALQTLELSNAMTQNARLVNLSRRHTKYLSAFEQRLQELKNKRFSSVETMAEVLYKFAPKNESHANIWANAIGGASLSNGGNTSLYGTSAGADTYIEGENLQAIVGGFGSYGYGSQSGSSTLNSWTNNTNFGLYSRVFSNKHEFDFNIQGAIGNNNESLMFKNSLLQGLNQGYNYMAYSTIAQASYGYDFTFLNSALVLKPSVGVSYQNLGTTNIQSHSTQLALSNGANNRNLFNINANLEARYYYGNTSYMYVNAGILQGFANFGTNNAVSLSNFAINASHSALNTNARVMIGGELQLNKGVYLNLGLIYAHNFTLDRGSIASNLGMRYSF
ncbi:vacuolating cyotoxin family protein [Helicobacter cetorum]|uniref:Vacuolating cytotoxin autotransporter n=1 Tax=Helicobacter cetorum (strain ATCC BAA-429 / MIT 00-7128) TaxID=182217 RepID=I0EMB1_HELC0|nr:vacuolating cyotoxin family protein [Helicobacter cetorum]AFI04080.1 vacuolating cytotoxin [Helicobacter cetorum MIT 00-7128]